MDINFIKPTPVINQEKAIKKWYYHMLFFTIPMICLCVIATVFQGIAWYQAKHEQRSLKITLKSFDQASNEYNQLMGNEKNLKKKLAKITKHLSNPHDPSTILKMVKTQLKDNSNLEHIAYASQITELAIGGDAKNIGHLCSKLPQALSCKSLHMCSLEYHDNKVKAVLKNTVEKKAKAT